MNKVFRRSFFALVLAVVLLLGVLAFVGRYFSEADQWAGNVGNLHLYDERGILQSEMTILDAEGEMLYRADSGTSFADNSLTRMAFLHITGDREGNIPKTLLDEYGGKLIGYNKLTGLDTSELKDGEQTLTIHADVQRAALQAMGTNAGAVGVYNYKTGEILCAVSTPTYDPENVPDIEGNPYYTGVYVNRFFDASYTPGSVFKTITFAAAIENLPDWENRTWYCSGSYPMDNHTVNCHGVHGEVGLQDAFAYSCNVIFAQIAVELGEETLEKYVKNAGVLDRLSFDGHTTHKGQFKLEYAKAFDIAWAGIGQHEDLVNPCQYMTFMGSIANDGQAAMPYLVESVKTNGKVSYRAKRNHLQRTMEASTAEILRKMLRYNVQTMYSAITLDLPVCAKSGTAEVGDKNNATFAGFIDDSDYPLAFFVVVEGGGAGSQVAAPIANAVLQQCVAAMQ